MRVRSAICHLLISYQALAALAVALDASKLLPSDTDATSPLSSHLLKDVLKTISEKQSWNLEEIRVSNLDVRNARVGTSQRIEIALRMGKNDLVFKFLDEVPLWTNIGKRGEFASLLKEFSSKTVLSTFKFEGPFELRVGRNDDLSLTLPMNVTHTGLKRLLVGEGITVEVERAQEISLFHASLLGLSFNRSMEINNRNQFWPFRPSFCMPLVPIHISGSASMVAYRTRNSNAYIETTFPSRDTIELLPEKCYSRHFHKKQTFPMESLSSRVALLENLLGNFLGDRIFKSSMSGFVKAKIAASTLVRFQLELERDVRVNDTLWRTLAEWRTKPTVERVQFRVLARVEAERLKPLMVEKVKPYIGVDSASWSNIMSNISFTMFPSVLVPPEALTLDVKW
ncbi:PREDICTED: uncharacterized protein LOC104595864 [Nelumbo nucifera]|uniref:Uncharacterized protein LOC104595864 n=1 Tax=Nelumbo nucifera TaxID=4432 RepID=A0A1U8A0L3_NELNU|nr:PREDICTED: uncharacterized protein LOC104595864 [Nelumbo nucifera]